ncbi:hypothetical protein C2W62_41115, partial [Candidatus Entotheonella serta]
YLKQLYPPIHLREIERILERKFGYKTNHHTLKVFLAPYETPIVGKIGFRLNSGRGATRYSWRLESTPINMA